MSSAVPVQRVRWLIWLVTSLLEGEEGHKRASPTALALMNSTRGAVQSCLTPHALTRAPQTFLIYQKN